MVGARYRTPSNGPPADSPAELGADDRCWLRERVVIALTIRIEECHRARDRVPPAAVSPRQGAEMRWVSTRGDVTRGFRFIFTPAGVRRSSGVCEGVLSSDWAFRDGAMLSPHLLLIQADPGILFL